MRSGNKRPSAEGIEKEFFDFDEENRIAHIRLEFERPEKIFDLNAVTKTPMMSDDFIEWITRSFEIVPDDYQLDIRIFFDEMGGHGEEELAEICKKNILLETKTHRRKARRQNLLALSLCALGLVFVLLSIGINLMWKDGGVIKEIIAFVMEIAATVPFWSAADIYFVQGGERRRNVANFINRFHAITFHKKEN